jgi:hypothetical protein
MIGLFRLSGPFIDIKPFNLPELEGASFDKLERYAAGAVYRAFAVFRKPNERPSL